MTKKKFQSFSIRNELLIYLIQFKNYHQLKNSIFRNSSSFILKVAVFYIVSTQIACETIMAVPHCVKLW